MTKIEYDRNYGLKVSIMYQGPSDLANTVKIITEDWVSHFSFLVFTPFKFHGHLFQNSC